MMAGYQHRRGASVEGNRSRKRLIKPHSKLPPPGQDMLKENAISNEMQRLISGLTAPQELLLQMGEEKRFSFPLAGHHG